MSQAIVVVLTVLAALGSGLMAGFFFSFSVVVMAALGRISSTQGIAAMQAINVVVLNPWFFVAFFGTAAVCAALGVSSLFSWQRAGSAFLLAGSALYLLGAIVVTMWFNVPLNNALARIAADSGEGASLWPQYLSQWTSWNHVRTITSLAAATLFVTGLRALPPQ